MEINNINQAQLHPGQLLELELKYMKISVKNLALPMGLSVEELKEVIQQKKPMTEDMAKSIEEILDIPASYFINAQKEHDKLMQAQKEQQ
jgi:HTH-type transcriptional regulator/antitoxin HigA